MNYYIVLAIFGFAAVTAAESCKENSDCGRDECCVEKRFLIFEKTMCQPLGEEGAKCDDERGLVLGLIKYEDACPCKDGLVCKEQKKDKWWDRPSRKCVKEDTEGEEATTKVEEPEGEEATTKAEEPEGEETH